MTSYQADPETVATQSLSTNEMIDELLDAATSDDPVAVIQTVIASLEQDDTAMVSRTNEGHLWKFKYGSVEVFVQLTGLSDEDTLTVWAAVLQLPAKNELQLMRKLMEMNWSGTFEACFGIFNEQVVVSASRTLAGVSPGEISRLITIVATLADDNDDNLQAEFGQ